MVAEMIYIKRIFCSQYTAGFAMMMASASSGMFTGWATATFPLYMSKQPPINVNKDEISWIMSLHFLGYVISPIPAGILMDRFGRKTILLYSVFLLPLTSWILVAASVKSLELLYVARFLSGLWNGIVNTISPSYIAEIAYPTVRGRLNTFNNLTFRIGNLFTIIIAIFVPYEQFPIFLSLPTILFLIICPFIPESPYFYTKQNDRIAAKESLTWLRGDKTETDVEIELCQIEVAVKKQTENQRSFIGEISKRGNVRALIIVETLSILLRLAGIASVLSYLSISLPGVKSLNPMVFIIIIELVRLISGFISSLIIDKVRSKILLIVTSLVCGLLMMITSFWYFIEDATFNGRHNKVHHYVNHVLWWVPFMCITLHSVFYSLGVSPVCLNVRSELFPINIKGKCLALTCTVTAFTSFALNKSYLITEHNFGLYFNFGVYATGNILIAVFASIFLIETSGKTLQQIQDELNNVNHE